MKEWDFGEYDVIGEPDKREKADAWMTAIGLQRVDGLEVSDYLIETAKRNIEGEITQNEAIALIDKYYEAKTDNVNPDEKEEADKSSARISKIIAVPGFHMSPVYYLGLHKLIFQDVFSNAGKIRDVELTKKEWVLKGDSVSYTPSMFIADTLEYEFDRERKFKYAGLSDDAFVSHFSRFIASLWQIHPFHEGNMRTVAVFAIKYLQTMGHKVTNDPFKKNSWYFRNALVRANYENSQCDIQKTFVPLEEFFRVLLFGEGIELKNRCLHADFEKNAGVGT